MIRLYVASLAVAAIISAGGGAFAADGMIVVDSEGTVAETADRLEALIEEGPPTLVARVDHQANAASVGADIAPSVVLIFGNPAAGTPIIAASPKAGLDLPVRVLIWEDDGATRIGYLDPAELTARYGVEGADKAIENMGEAIAGLVERAAAAQ